MLKKVLLSFSLFLLVFVWITAQTSEDPSAPPFDLERIQRATVFIMQARTTLDKPLITCVSSGTLVSRDGLILTNAHATVTNADCPGDRLIIALTVRPGEPPIPTYQADVIQANEGLDIALLRINREFDGRLLNIDELSLPFVELANSDQVQLDETVWVLGYPGIGDDPVLTARSLVLGFTAEPSGGAKSWFKINVDQSSDVSVISGTMSGGGAYDRAGRLIGIPTTAPITRQVAVSACQPLQDTNGDSLVNQNDVCIPLGGSINVLRPSNFARPLIRSASLGLNIETLTLDPRPSTPTLTTPPRITNLFFAPSVVNNAPSTVINNLPTGNSELYLFFDYENMTPDTIYELLVTYQGIPSPIFSLSPVRWSGGQQGLWYIGTNGQPLPNGDYEFTLFVDGIAAAPPKLLRVGGPPTNDPSFSSLAFAIIEGNQAFGDGYVIATGTTATARFIYNNLENGTPWTAIWYYNGVELSPRGGGEWFESSPSGSQTVSIFSQNGLPPGRYRLALYIADRLTALSDFTIAGTRRDAYPLIFSNAGFAIADSDTEALTANRIDNYSNPADALYFLFDWSRLAQGTRWRIRWLVDNTIFYDQEIAWNGSEDGQNFLMRLTAPERVPDGTYQVELLIDNVLLQSELFEMGIGQLPIDPFARAEGVQLRGQILDSATGTGIPNVTFMLISEDYSVGDFEARQDQLYAIATTDRNGRFQIERPLQFNAPYSVLIAVDGYLPMPADGVEVDETTPNPLEMTIYLTRDGS